MHLWLALPLIAYSYSALLFAPSARGAEGHKYLSQLTQTLVAPGAIALDSQNDPWVVDSGRGVIDEFDPSGSLLQEVGSGAFGQSGTEVYSLAVAKNGDLFAADSETGTIDVFDPNTKKLIEKWNGSEEPTPSNKTPNAEEGGKKNFNGFERVLGHNNKIGVTIDQSTGDVYVASTSYRVIDKFTASGEYQSQISGVLPNAISIAVVNGEFYILAPGPNGYSVEKRDSTGKTLWVINGSTAPPGVFGFEPSGGSPLSDEGIEATINSGLTVDSAGHVYVVNSHHKVVDEFSSAGDYLGQIGGGENPAHHLFDPGGVGVDSAGDVYFTDFNPLRSSPSQGTGEVDIFGPEIEQRTLAVSVSGGASVLLGGGEDSSVRSSPAGIEETWASCDPLSASRPPFQGTCAGFKPNLSIGCEWKCSAQFMPGVKVSLSEVPATGFKFVGWSGGCTGKESECEVTLNTDLEVGAQFSELPKFPLTVVEEGKGTGVVTSEPPGIECPGTCSSEFFEGQKVKLTAKAGPESEFGKWTGCEAEPSREICEVEILKATEVKVEFKEIPQRDLTVMSTGSGGGEVTSKPSGIRCPGICSHPFNFDEKVILRAEPNATSRVVRWTGCESEPSKEECQVTLSGNLSVEVEFEEIPQKTLVVHVTGPGTGVVRSELPATGIECGVNCSHAYNEGTVVELVAQPTDGTSVFQGWSGGGCSGAGTCVVTLNESMEVTAIFGLVASPSCSNGQLRAEQLLAGGLPDCRAYEMVSPVNKNDNDAVVPNFYGRSAASGEAITYESRGSFEHPMGSPYNSQYLSQRTDAGWVTKNISPPTTPDVTTPIESQWMGMDFTDDLSKGMVINGDPPLDGNEAGFESLYVSDIAGGTYQFVEKSPGEPYQFVSEGVQLGGSSADLNHVIFEKENRVFEWTSGHIVSIDSEPSHTGSGRNVREFDGAWHDVSADGSRVFFTRRESSEEGQLFVRENGTDAVEVSAPQSGVTDPHGPQPASFWGANVDGSRVFFTSKAELTSNANTGSADNAANLYEYNVATKELVDLTVDPADPDGAGVEGVVALSEDGSYVYFVASGVLTSGGQSGEPVLGKPNLYVQHDGATSFVATLGVGDVSDWAKGLGKNTVAVTPGGSRLAFQSKDSLTGYDNRDVGTGEMDEEVFLYDAGTGRLVCVSCNPSGARPVGPSDLYSHFNNVGEGYLYKPRNFSEDGKRLFFQSGDGLVQGDSNGLADVYEYENGFVSLISNGTGSFNSFLQDVSASGNDVFFATADQLVSQDHDNRVDLYDARVGGGFPAEPVVLPGCDNNVLCRPRSVLGGSSSGVTGGLSSATFTGSGNFPLPAPVVAGKKVVTKRKVLSRSQLLAKALRVCRHKPKGHKRTACEKSARKRYGPVKKGSKSRGGGRS